MRDVNSKPFFIGLILISLSYFIAFPDVKYNEYFTDEDSWIENISALAFLLASILFFVSFWKSNGSGLNLGFLKTKRNWIFLAIGLMFFVAFGEEISWGQRIFGWSTPEALAEVNYQQETNLHNLDFFTFKNETNDSFWSFLFVLNAGRIFFYFWFSFMVLLPLVCTIIPKFKAFINRINIPVPKIWMGLLMISTLVLAKAYKLIINSTNISYSNSIDEIMEGNYAVLMAVLAIHFYNRISKSDELSHQGDAEHRGFSLNKS